ncbi:hypothetical protein [Streptomyces tsukubensis]|nr:hypothetical protein [Streptomyces tsukubensis]QFR96565.1 hypothetical protein GBW32_30450 [Streptomyces tsukubensis]
MNHRRISATVVLASVAGLLALTGGTSIASPNAATTANGAQARATTRKPCRLPAGYKHFFELHSAKNFQGNTVVRVTPETCEVNTGNDEDVIYTPSGAARSYVFASGATVKVLKDTKTVKVTPKWLVNHELANTPHFSYRLNGRSQITAMEEIYHP